MPTVEDYSLFLNGILQTAKERVAANGRLDMNDTLDLFKIAKFKDGQIDEKATGDLKTVYTSYYAKMTPQAIQAFEMYIVTYDINAYMRKYGGAWSDWYVGITTNENIENQLFTQHQVKEEGGCWIYRTVTSNKIAKTALDYYKKHGARVGEHGSGPTAVKIYAFKLAAAPKKENPFSQVNLNRSKKPINPNRKAHDLDPKNYRQCYSCSGSGVRTCSSCGGTGGRSESRVDYDWDNNPIYRTEWVSCYSCSGGQQTCTTCGGSGTVNK